MWIKFDAHAKEAKLPKTHHQMPVACLLILSLPQKVQVYLECCEISIFFTVFLREAPYLGFKLISLSLSHAVELLTWCHTFRWFRPSWCAWPSLRLLLQRSADMNKNLSHIDSRIWHASHREKHKCGGFCLQMWSMLFHSNTGLSKIFGNIVKEEQTSSVSLVLLDTQHEISGQKPS